MLIFLPVMVCTLHYKSKELYEIIMFAYVFFTKAPEKLCRNSFFGIITNFTSIFHILVDIEKAVMVRLSNIFMKRFSQLNKGINKGRSKRIAAKLK